MRGRGPASEGVGTLTGHLKWHASGLDCRVLATTRRFEGRGELIRPSPLRPSEPSDPPPVPLAPPSTPPPGVGPGSWRLGWYWQPEEVEHPEEPEADRPVREVITTQVKQVPKPKRRSRSPICRSSSVPEPKHPPKRRLINLPKSSVVNYPKVAEKVDIQESEPVVNPGGAASSSRAVKPVITPAKVKAEPRTSKKAPGGSSKAAAVQKSKGEIAEAEAKQKADKEARLEARKKAEEEEQAFLQHKQPEEFPLPSLLINICSEALKLFAAGRLKKGG